MIIEDEDININIRKVRSSLSEGLEDAFDIAGAVVPERK